MTTQKKFSITANGTNMGIFEGVTSDEAILAYVKEAGYVSIEDASEVCGQSVDSFHAELTVTEL